jgi:hypothetical protein
MDMIKRHDVDSTPETRPTPRAYKAPKLVVYGHVRQLTQGGSVLSGENPGSMSTNLP